MPVIGSGVKLAFYAPLKAPTHPTPSGDRLIGRLLMQALGRAGYEVDLASTFRSWDGRGDGNRQRRIRDLGARLAERLARRYQAGPAAARPRAWFTYHVYHKAPDWLGPAVSRALGIPYLVAEASYAPKQAGGPWSMGHDAAREAIQHAAAVIAINSKDMPCVRRLLSPARRLVHLRPFLDLEPYRVLPARNVCRRGIASRHEIAVQSPWLVCVAMMRAGNKRDSYGVLAEALGRLSDQSWHLLVVGDGELRAEVARAFEPLGGQRVTFVGVQPPEVVREYLAAADLFVWPAVREPLGMALLEAQAAGLPVVAGRSGGVADIVRDGETGRLLPPGDVGAFAGAVMDLLRVPECMAQLGATARERALREHGLEVASRSLRDIVSRACNGVGHA